MERGVHGDTAVATSLRQLRGVEEFMVPRNDKGRRQKAGMEQSIKRWTPTTDLIRILKDLYYNNGVRSPSAEQIQRISARLRQYG
ncbi:unnamed protein product [Ilex paraguariensis]|uniref:Uncharacterized protein n=1 Tax=Ilex paraguariensis TaxID=185542 RepID=A0ABC8RK26_9AQUA